MEKVCTTERGSIMEKAYTMVRGSIMGKAYTMVRGCIMVQMEMGLLMKQLTSLRF